MIRRSPRRFLTLDLVRVIIKDKTIITLPCIQPCVPETSRLLRTLHHSSAVASLVAAGGGTSVPVEGASPCSVGWFGEEDEREGSEPQLERRQPCKLT